MKTNSVRHKLVWPNYGASTCDTGERVSTTAATAIVDLLAGRKPRFVVDEKVWGANLRAKLK